jgi:uncharacterized protein (TIGR03437 family)
VRKLGIAFFLLAGAASAQFTITDVVNAASRIPGSRPSGGIAQGSLFAVSGRGIGPSDFQQASFPLPTTAGLAGVTIQVNVAGQIVDAIMVYVAPNEVAAILPSGTPLGAGTVTVNNNGVSASKPVTVVATAFGIFTRNYGFGAGVALAFNLTADGATTPNTATQSAAPGTDVLINGTGLGAIPSDETQPGVTDSPSTPVQVFVGTQPATVVSAGRGVCCDGVDPAYRVPQGIAAWDVIRVTIPDGVTGCSIPVVIQTGSRVSNLATISIDSTGACSLPVSTLPPDLALKLADQTGFSGGGVSLSRGFRYALNNAGALNITRVDSGSAAFIHYNNVPASMFAPDIVYPENVCLIGGFPDASGRNTENGNPVTIVPLQPVPFDAGSPITVKGPAGTRTIVKRTVGKVFDYPGVTFGDTTPGNYYDPGQYTITGAGGPDVGGFTATAEVSSTPFVWTNVPTLTTPIDRTQDLIVTWTGGIPGTQVIVEGGSFTGGVNETFLCAAPVSAGKLTVPSFVLLNLPASPASTAQGTSSLVVSNRKVFLFNAPGLDYGTATVSTAYSVAARYK